MFLLKITNKVFSSYNAIIHNHMKNLSYNVRTLKFVNREIFSFYIC